MSVIYDMTCWECGKHLDYTVKLDSGDDLIVTVEPCKNCLDEKYDEGFKDGDTEARS